MSKWKSNIKMRWVDLKTSLESEMSRIYLRLMERFFRLCPEVKPNFREPDDTSTIQLKYSKEEASRNEEIMQSLWEDYLSWRLGWKSSEKMDSIDDEKTRYLVYELRNCDFIYNRFYNIYVSEKDQVFSNSWCHPRWTMAHTIYRKVKMRKPVILESGVLVILGHANSETNYFHFLLEIVGAFLLAQGKGIPFKTIASYRFCKKWQREIMAAISRNWDINWIGLSATEEYRSDKIFVSSRPIGHSSFSTNMVQRYGTLFEALVPSKRDFVKYNDRIFISREDANTRKISGLESLWSQLEKNGFTRVVCSELTVADQAQVFKAAKIIVAEHGAALANLVFCSTGTKVFEIFGEYVSMMYGKLAVSAGCQYDYSIAGQMMDDAELCQLRLVFDRIVNFNESV